MKKRKFVFGLGTGCCGTSSLAYLLNEQKVLKLLEFLDVKNPRLIVSRKNRREDGTIF